MFFVNFHIKIDAPIFDFIQIYIHLFKKFQFVFLKIIRIEIWLTV